MRNTGLGASLGVDVTFVERIHLVDNQISYESMHGVRGGILKRGPKLRDWILAKLINAENACYKSKIFSCLEKKTR